MGKKSVRENKNIYQQSREEIGMTRAEASEAMEFVSESRIEKIESEKSEPHPEEIMAMAEAYKKPGLCNYYCSRQCPIGQKYIPEVKVKDLSQIVLEMLASLNALNREKDRLIEISADGVISESELMDFALIQDRLDQISLSIDSMKLWASNTIASGAIDKNLLEEARRKIRSGK